jgi:hypothetical protein
VQEIVDEYDVGLLDFDAAVHAGVFNDDADVFVDGKFHLCCFVCPTRVLW